MLELWRENCKLIWKLQPDMKIANWYENCKAILTFWCIVPMWKFAIFIWDTPGMETCSGTERMFWFDCDVDDKNSPKQSLCRKPPRYVPYKCNYVPYDGTFCTSNQGQTLDVWGWHPADVNAELVVTPDVITSLRKIPWTSQDISVGISADLLDHTGWVQGWIQFNGRSVR